MAKFKDDPAMLAAMRKKWKRENSKIPFSTWMKKGVKPKANFATEIALDPLSYAPRKKRKKPESALDSLMNGVH
tara:strand:+ start:704 stop:925 length:222 start_codon:yes stop_codon:yes gene_type:complete